MSELEERLNAVLSNPEEMSRIAAMAQKLMGELPSESAAASSAPEAAGGGLLRQSRREPAGAFVPPHVGTERKREKTIGRRARAVSERGTGAPSLPGAAHCGRGAHRGGGLFGMGARRWPITAITAAPASARAWKSLCRRKRRRAAHRLPPESAPERPPPPPENEKTPPSPLLSLRSGLDGIFERLDPKRLETEDLLVLAILWLLYRESGDWEMLIALGAYYFDL